MYNVHPYFSLKNLGKNVHIIHGKTGIFNEAQECRTHKVQCKEYVLPSPSWVV